MTIQPFSTISLFDTSIATGNIGDEIIMDAVNDVIHEIFHSNRIVRLASHDKIGITSLSTIKKSNFGIVGGSNILSSSMNKYKQWQLDWIDFYFLRKKVLLLGVGWRKYQQQTNFYTKSLLRRICIDNFEHSVRDQYTLDKLNKIGINNVINTSCPTMWKLNREHCNAINKSKSSTVIFTLTDYDKNPTNDKKLISCLFNNYQSVAFWPQGRSDMQYIKELDINNQIKIIAPNLKAYNDFLTQNDCDYIGTRLHGGVRALQKKKRSIIIGIDNRATEKKKDFNLLVLDRSEIDSLDSMINKDLIMDIKIPEHQITKWKNQFLA